MTLINERNSKIDNAARIQDTFQNFQVEVDANQYDRVYSFFKKRFQEEKPALSFTSELFRVAKINQRPIDSLLAEFEKSSDEQIPVLLAYYLNTIRNKATYLGVSARLSPPVGVARNIRP